ncbi:MAG: hypothetical protein O2955_15965 [Planctomycetota bacterium]|nr:hypothetical protein [Planctomycetota bacterium]MDA1214012.1 hypothetical protein [Planctomycetota bacterium]
MPTPNPTLPQLQLESLKDRAIAEIRRRWEQPISPERSCRIPSERVDDTARNVLDAMLTRPFRMTPFPEGEEYQGLFDRVRYWVGKGTAIRIRIGYGPMKNLNNARHSRAEWAEFFALSHLCAWYNKVRENYSPGLRIKIVFDDSTIRMANRHDHNHMASYMKSVKALVAAMGYESFIAGTMRQSTFAWLFHFGWYQLAERRVRQWERDPANRERIEQMTDYARRNLVLPAGVSETERDRLSIEASHRYRVYNQALQISGFSRLGHSLIAMYLDGQQHHVQHRSAFHLTSLGKGHVVQPWQGDGGLCENGRGKLVPTVLTARRRDELTTIDIPGLDILPLEGFESIPVCWKAD